MKVFGSQSDTSNLVAITTVENVNSKGQRAIIYSRKIS